MTRGIRHDGGFGAIELMVASVIGLLVLAGAYLLYQGAMKGFGVVENATVSGRTAGDVMTRMTKPMREIQNLQNNPPGDTNIVFSAPISDANKSMCWWNFYAEQGTGDDSGTTVLKLGKTPGMSHANTVTTIVSKDIANLQYGTPLFSYYTTPGAPIADPLQRADKTRMLRLSLVIVPKNKVAHPAAFRVQTDVYLRNSQSQ